MYRIASEVSTGVVHAATMVLAASTSIETRIITKEDGIIALRKGIVPLLAIMLRYLGLLSSEQMAAGYRNGNETPLDTVFC